MIKVLGWISERARTRYASNKVNKNNGTICLIGNRSQYSHLTVFNYVKERLQGQIKSLRRLSHPKKGKIKGAQG